jgi:hypothetical protein
MPGDWPAPNDSDATVWIDSIIRHGRASAVMVSIAPARNEFPHASGHMDTFLATSPVIRQSAYEGLRHALL